MICDQQTPQYLRQPPATEKLPVSRRRDRRSRRRVARAADSRPPAAAAAAAAAAGSGVWRQAPQADSQGVRALLPEGLAAPQKGPMPSAAHQLAPRTPSGTTLDPFGASCLHSYSLSLHQLRRRRSRGISRSQRGVPPGPGPPPAPSPRSPRRRRIRRRRRRRRRRRDPEESTRADDIGVDVAGCRGGTWRAETRLESDPAVKESRVGPAAGGGRHLGYVRVGRGEDMGQYKILIVTLRMLF